MLPQHSNNNISCTMLSSHRINPDFKHRCCVGKCKQFPPERQLSNSSRDSASPKHSCTPLNGYTLVTLFSSADLSDQEYCGLPANSCSLALERQGFHFLHCGACFSHCPSSLVSPLQLGAHRTALKRRQSRIFSQASLQSPENLGICAKSDGEPHLVVGK